MAIPSKQIGQSAEANLLWNISKQLDNLRKTSTIVDPALLAKIDELISVNSEIEISAENINLNTDDLETLIAEGNALLEEIKNNTAAGSSFDGQLTQEGTDVSDTNPLPVNIIGSIETVALSDTTFQDSTGQLFVYRDNGVDTPIAYKIPDWTVYTPIAPVTATSSSLTNYALEAGGNLEVIKNKLPTPKDGKTPVLPANLTNKFREAFENYTPGTRWTQVLGNGDIIQIDGNTAASSYLVISKNPLASGESRIETIADWEMPFEVAVGLSLSQRTLGQEFSVELVSDEAPLPTPVDLAISAIQQVASVLTITTTANHNLTVGMRIGVRDCVDSRMNYTTLVVATTPTPTQFTVLAGPMGNLPSVTAGPFASGFVFFRSSLGLAPNGTSMIFENTSATNASFYVRSESGDVLPSGTIAGNQSVSVGTTSVVQPINTLGAYAFQPSNEYRLTQFIDGIQWSDVSVDSVAAATNRNKRTQIVPDIAHNYKFRIRAVNQASLTRPNAQIISAVKTGTATATITTDVPHGLTIADFVNLYGLRDQAATAFPNLLVATAVASIVSPTVFTVVIGTAATVTSFGGFVAKVNGGNLMSALGANAIVVSTVARTNNVVTLVGNGSWAGLLIGDYLNLVGVRDNASGDSLNVEGAYRIRNIATTTLELEPIGTTPTGANIVTTNCGGAVIKRTDMRISYVRALDFERQRVEMLTRPGGDSSNATPVQITNNPAISLPSTPAGTNYVGQFGEPIPTIIADVASGAITSSTTTAAITPAFGSSYEVNIPVTAVTGTNPTMDVSIEESDDNGTNWLKVYDFPRITATGMYRSPKLLLTGNRVRYVQTLGGTSPSFTRTLHRLQCSDIISPIRQLIDRTIVLTTLNSVTPSLNVQNCDNLQMNINVGAIATTAPAIQLEGSDDNGLTWTAISTPQAAVANSTISLRVADINVQLARARVSTAGVAVTAGHILIKGY